MVVVVAGPDVLVVDALERADERDQWQEEGERRGSIAGVADEQESDKLDSLQGACAPRRFGL